MSAFDHMGAIMLVGGGAIDQSTLALARSCTDTTIAADGGADLLLELGLMPDAIVGDMDSLGDLDRWRRLGAEIRVLDEQDTTDFEKCLYSTRASLYVGVGFTGKRADHMLAALHAMLAHGDKRVVLIDQSDAICVLGRSWTMATEPGDRVSLFPLTPIRGVRSQGLAWPIDDLPFACGERVGTSNRATGSAVSLEFDRPGMVMIVDRDRLPNVIAGWKVEDSAA